MSDAVSVDPRRARQQPSGEAAQPTETSPISSDATMAPAEPAEASVAPAEAVTAAPEDLPFSLPPQDAPGPTSTQTTEPASQQTTTSANGDAASDAAGPTAARPDSGEMDAAIAATLAMDSEPAPDATAAPVPGPAETETSANEVQSTGTEQISRDATGTPTLYQAAASAKDVPGAVATPPLATAVPTGGQNGNATETAETASPLPSANVNARPSAAGTSSLSRVAQLTARIEKDPLDGEAQLALLHDAESKGDLERTREVYERFLSVFPDAVSLRVLNFTNDISATPFLCSRLCSSRLDTRALGYTRVCS